MKAGYRRRLVQRLLINVRTGIELKVDLPAAIQMIAAAWTNVKHDMVANCFRSAGYVVAAEEGSMGALDDDGVEYLDDAILSC